MKEKIIALIVLGLTLFSCNKGNDKQADTLLTRARALYAKQSYAAAKSTLDSISKVAPKAFPQISAGLDLLDSVRYGENIRTILQTDTLIKQTAEKITALKSRFYYKINPKYQDKGQYIPKIFSATGTGQTGLQSGLEADGSLFIESFCGKPIRHTKVKASAGNASAETLSVTDDGANFRFRSGSTYSETVHFAGKRENGLVAFIVANSNKNITISLIGSSTTSFPLSPAVRKALTDTYDLAKLFSERDSLGFKVQKSKMLIKYLDSKRAQAMTTRAEDNLKKK